MSLPARKPKRAGGWRGRVLSPVPMNRRQRTMKRNCRVLAAQKSGGVFKIGHFDSPASMSMLEESTLAVNRPIMGVFNNLVMFKQDVPQNTLRSIVPELAT